MSTKRILSAGLLCLSVLVMLLAAAAAPVRAATQNPILWADVPDPDVIRVGSNYYMVSTTMHFNPGVPVMKSTDLVNWEIVNYVYSTLESGDRQNLNNGQNDYGRGSWAASLRYRSGRYYVVFASLTSGKTYIYQTTNIEAGPWSRSVLNSVYHDPSLLLDDDGRVYLTYGGGDIRIIELTADATAVKSGGLNQIIIPNAGAIAGSGGLAAEGSHIQKINGRYYVFLISWPSDGMRTQLVYRSDRVNGTYQGQVMLRNSGIAQGGVVDTPDGRWYALLFRDYGAVGRIPYLVPMTWSNAWPVPGDPFDTGISVNPSVKYAASDEFAGGSTLGRVWQWNHNPDNALWSLAARPGFFRLTNGSVRTSILSAKNTLTQRTFGPESSAVVALETGSLKDGDYAGLAAFQHYYGFVGVKVSGTTKSIVMVRGSTNDPNQTSTPVEVASVPLSQDRIYLKVYTDYRNRTDKASFSYSLNGSQWTAIGSTVQMAYTLPHFVGYRFALFTYATRSTGGSADFDFFRVQAGNTVPPLPTATATRAPTATPAAPTATPAGPTATAAPPTPSPTSAPATPTPGNSGACSPVSATITAPFSYDGAGSFCWQIANIPSYLNSWNLDSLTVNGVSFANTYVAASDLPPKINGAWYVRYTGQYGWSHFEAK